MDRRVRRVVLVGMVVVAGLLLAGTASATPPEDPEEDVIGWESGYWHNESIDVDQSDGLTDEELEAYVSRTAARVEVIRDREFNETVPVSVIPRSEFENETATNGNESYGAWNNQVWEALFVVGEDEDVEDVLHATSTAATTGGYFFASQEIKIITDDPEDASIDRGTLAHELVHAQQDQYHDLANLTLSTETQDEQLAALGLSEGEANYIEDRYQERCGEEWECVDTPTSGATSGTELNRGVLYTLYHPYSDGPAYVHSLVEREGWSAVDEAFESPPRSTTQIIHHTDEEPVPLEVEDEAEAGWRPFPEQGQNGTDTAGEASMFVMLWYQAWGEYGADTIDWTEFFEPTDPYAAFNYAAEPTAGWANDAILPYRKEGVGGPEYGYVWVTEWDTAADAREFREAYIEILSAHDADRLGPRTWVIEAGQAGETSSFADAFRVQIDGSRVTIVNAPSVEDLADVRPSISGIDSTLTITLTPDPPMDEGPGSPMEPDDTPTVDGELTTAPPQSGFGVLAAFSGVAGLWWLHRRRRLR